MNRRRASTALLAASLSSVVGLSGCAAAERDGRAAPPRASTTASSTASAKQAAALADGRVTWDEYTAGFEAFRQCFHDAGLELREVRVDRHLYVFGAPEDPAAPGLFDRCYDKHWSGIDEVWQTDHADESYSAESLRACLQRHRLAAVRSHHKNVETMLRAGLTAEDCADGSGDE